MFQKINRVYVLHGIKENTYQLLIDIVTDLRENGSEIVDADTFVDNIDDPNNVLLTFDDGYEYRDKRIINFLRMHRIRVLSFVIPFAYNYTNVRVPWKFFQDNADIIDVGSHSLTHSKIITNPTKKEVNDENLISYKNMNHGDIDYSLLNREWLPLLNRKETDHEYMNRLHQEVSMSKNIIERNLGKPCKYFAYPWGKYDVNLIDLLKTNNYKAAFALNSGSNSKFEISRVALN